MLATASLGLAFPAYELRGHESQGVWGLKEPTPMWVPHSARAIKSALARALRKGRLETAQLLQGALD